MVRAVLRENRRARRRAKGAGREACNAGASTLALCQCSALVSRRPSNRRLFDVQSQESSSFHASVAMLEAELTTLRKQWERETLKSKARAAELLQQAQGAEDRLAAAQASELSMREALAAKEAQLLDSHTALSKLQSKFKALQSAQDASRTSGADLEVRRSPRKESAPGSRCSAPPTGNSRPTGGDCYSAPHGERRAPRTGRRPSRAGVRAAVTAARGTASPGPVCF